MYLSTKQVAEKWEISDRRVRIICEDGKIDGAFKDGRSWKIPEHAQKPIDNRYKVNDNIPKEFVEVFTRIENKKLLLKKNRPLTKGEVDRLREEFVVEYTYNSNAIEGNTLTLSETEAVLKDNVTIGGKPLSHHLEAIGHRDAFEYMIKLIDEKKPFSEKVIKEIHSLVLADKQEDRGVYRRIPVRIMGSKYEPPQPYQVAPLMEELIREQKKMQSIHTIERVALFHLKFETIHPFIDGNGRCGRLLLNFDLMKQGYPNINIKFSDRQRYYECFNDYHTTDSHSKMVELISMYVEQELDRYLEIVE